MVIVCIVYCVFGRHPLSPILYQEEVMFENEDCSGQVTFRHVTMTRNCSIPELQPDVCNYGGIYRCATGYDEAFAMPNFIATKYTDTLECLDHDAWRDLIGFVSGCFLLHMDGEVVGSYSQVCESGNQRQLVYMNDDCTGEIKVDTIWGATDTFDECIPTIHSGKWKMTHCYAYEA